MEHLQLNQAWIVRWYAYGDEERLLKPYGLTSNVIDILSARYDFDKYIVPYAENLYRQKMLSLSERFRLAHYNHRAIHKKFFGGAVPKSTHYGSAWYKQRAECFEGNLQSKACQELISSWRKYPEYVVVGNSTAVEIKKVFDLVIQEMDNGDALLTWNEPLADGSSEERSQQTKDLIY